jgi:hypothetical protein
MAIRTKIILMLIIIVSYIGYSSTFQFLYAREKESEKIDEIEETTDINKAEKSKNKNKGFLNYEHKIQLKDEVSYDNRKTSLINPNYDFSSDINYCNRTIFDLETKLFFGKYFDMNFHDQAAWKWQKKEKIDETETKNFLQELFLTARIYDTLIIDVGRENIISGVAYGWNPTDFMISASISSSPDVRTIREQRLGAYLVKSSLFFDFGQVSALYAPKLDDIDTNKEARQLYKISTRPFDKLNLEFLYFKEKRDSAGSNMEFTLTDNLILQFEGSATKGSSIRTVESGQYSGDIYYSFDERDNKIYYKAVSGLNYTFSDMHNMIIEFYYNGEGYSKKEWEKYFSMLEYSNTHYVSHGVPYSNYISAASLMFQPTRMSRYYLFLRLSKQNIFLDNLDYAFFSYVNLYDGSAFLNLCPEYSFLDHLKTGIIYSYYIGKRKSEFGLSQNLYTALWYLSVYL